MILEYGLSRLKRQNTHDLGESAASIGVAAGQSIIRGLETALLAIPFAFVYQHRLFTFEATTPLAILGVFLTTEFVYYWHHRLSHRMRWLWATHSVHHSTTKLNLTAAIRLGWTGNLAGNFLFFLPLIWFGFHPVAVIAALGVNLFYQFFIHSELTPRLGILEWVLNTPTHHRVHHAMNKTCIDKNYGGMVIVFDRLFGTYAETPQSEPIRYGLVDSTPSLNPARIALGEWAKMLMDFRSARSWPAKFRVLFGPPGIQPDPVLALNRSSAFD